MTIAEYFTILAKYERGRDENLRTYNALRAARFTTEGARARAARALGAVHGAELVVKALEEVFVAHCGVGGTDARTLLHVSLKPAAERFTELLDAAAKPAHTIPFPFESDRDDDNPLYAYGHIATMARELILTEAIDDFRHPGRVMQRLGAELVA